MTERHGPLAKSRWRRLKSWLNRYWLAANVVLALAFVGLGCWGFASVDKNGPRWQSFYRALQLLVLEFPSPGDLSRERVPSGEIPPQLELARLGAAAVAASAVVQALSLLLGDQLTRLRVRWRMRNHVVVCGLGRAGPLVAQRFLAARHKVVTVHHRADDASVATCRSQGIPVLIGDATDSTMLRRARVDRARYLVAVCGDDTTNVEVAAAAERVASRQPRGALTCFVNLDDPDLSALVTEAEILTAGSRPVYLEYFNYAECGVSSLLDEHPSLVADDVAPHLLVVGLGAVGSRVVVEASRRFGVRRAGPERLRITAIDVEAHRLGAALHRRHPWLESVCDLMCWEVDVGSPQYQGGEVVQEADQARPFTGVCICVGDDVCALSAALVVRRRLAVSSVPIVIRTFGDGLLRMLDEAHHGPFKGVHAFNLLDRTCRPEVLLDLLITPKLARAAHENYVRLRKEEGADPASDPALADWVDLDQTYKRANLRQARHIGTKLKTIGYDIAPLSSLDGPPVTLSVDDVERLAILEHDSWWEDRKAEGWKQGDVRDKEKKTSPWMKEWKDLTEEIKEYDRQAVRQIPEILARVGFSLVRRNA